MSDETPVPDPVGDPPPEVKYFVVVKRVAGTPPNQSISWDYSGPFAAQATADAAALAFIQGGPPVASAQVYTDSQVTNMLQHPELIESQALKALLELIQTRHILQDEDDDQAAT